MGRSEELGTGVQNVYKYSKAYSGSDNITFREGDVFIARVPLTKSIELDVVNGGVYGGVNGGVNGGVKKLYETIKTNPNKRTNELAKLMNIPQKTVEKWIAKLKKANKIEFRGSSKTGGYFVIKNE